MREALGDGYTESLRKAAELVRDGKAKRFGFITTNSIHQTFNRRVIESFLEGRDGPPGRPANEKRMTKPKKGSKDLIVVDPSEPHSPGPPGGRSLPSHGRDGSPQPSGAWVENEGPMAGRSGIASHRSFASHAPDRPEVGPCLCTSPTPFPTSRSPACTTSSKNSAPGKP